MRKNSKHPFRGRCIFGRGVRDWRELCARAGDSVVESGSSWTGESSIIRSSGSPRQPSVGHSKRVGLPPHPWRRIWICRPVIMFPHRRQRRFSSTDSHGWKISRLRMAYNRCSADRCKGFGSATNLISRPPRLAIGLPASDFLGQICTAANSGVASAAFHSIGFVRRSKPQHPAPPTTIFSAPTERNNCATLQRIPTVI